MANKKKGQLTASSEFAKHLRKFGKRFFWKGERATEKKMIDNEINQNTTEKQDPNFNETIAKKIAILKNLDKKHGVFGSENHQYKFNAKLTNNQILAFEEKHKITLPKSYRDFILEFGNGGCGPFYGLMSLEKGVFDLPQNLQQSYIINLSEPFRFETFWNIENIKGSDTFKEEEYDDSKWCDGMLRICHEGCGYFINLVVTGKERGNIWVDGRVSEAGIFPANYYNGNKKTNFIEWYINWLDNAIDEINRNNTSQNNK